MKHSRHDLCAVVSKPTVMEYLLGVEAVDWAPLRTHMPVNRHSNS